MGNNLEFRARRVNDGSAVSTDSVSLSDFFFLYEHGMLKEVEQCYEGRWVKI